MLRPLILRLLRDQEQTEASRTLNTIVGILLATFHLPLLGLILLPQYSTRWLGFVLVIYAICIPTFILNRRGHTRLAGVYLVGGLWLFVTGAALTAGGIASFATLHYLVIVFIAGILHGSKGTVVTALLCILTALGLVVVEMTGHLPSPPILHTPLSRWVSITLLIVIIMGLQYLSVRRVHDALRLTRRELEERRQTEERIGLLQMITMDIAAAPDLPAALEVVLRRVCEKTGWELGQAWLPNEEGTSLSCCPAWFATDSNLEEFRSFTKEFVFAPGVGLPGAVWASRAPVWLRDVTQDANFPRTEFAEKAGFKAGLGVPILSGDEVVAVLEFFLRETRDEDERLVKVISAVAAQIDLMVERRRAEDALRASEQRFSIAFNSSPVLTAITELEGNRFLAVNDTFINAMGYSRAEVIGHTALELNLWVNPEDRLRVLQALEEAESVHSFEARLLTKKGDECVLLLSGDTIELEGQRCLLLAGIDITERKLAEEALRASTEQLRAFSARLQSVREEEGTRIAREIHDEMGGALTSMKWDLERIDKNLSKSRNGSEITEARNSIGSMTGLIESTISTVRRISSELRPGVLDALGLVAAIEWHALQFEGHTGMTCECEVLIDDVDLNRDQATVVFRILQEAMTNIMRHAQATTVNVILEEGDGEVVLEVRDNGRGITESEKLGLRSLGLLGMRERANSIGGRIDISGTAGKGTKLVVRLPIETRPSSVTEELYD